MDSSEREPSYYEVALTNRQVMAAFVVLLVCLVAAFLSGVWFGHAGEAPPALVAATKAAPSGSTAPAQKLEKLTFFDESKGSKPAASTSPATERRSSAPPPPAARPAAPSSAAAPTATGNESDQLRQTLETEMSAHRDAPASHPVSISTPGTRVKRTGKDDARAAAHGTPQASGSRAAVAPPSWIQVYSSSNGARARALAANLRRSGFATRVLETSVAGSMTYRVRVGPYDTRESAELAASRLRRKFRLDTWVTDQP